MNTENSNILLWHTAFCLLYITEVGICGCSHGFCDCKSQGRKLGIRTHQSPLKEAWPLCTVFTGKDAWHQYQSHWKIPIIPPQVHDTESLHTESYQQTNPYCAWEQEESDFKLIFSVNSTEMLIWTDMKHRCVNTAEAFPTLHQRPRFYNLNFKAVSDNAPSFNVCYNNLKGSKSFFPLSFIPSTTFRGIHTKTREIQRGHWCFMKCGLSATHI